MPALSYNNYSLMFEPAVISSPCIGVCHIDNDGICAGCYRNLREIAAWSALSEQQRLHLMREVLPVRAAERSR